MQKESKYLNTTAGTLLIHPTKTQRQLQSKKHTIRAHGGGGAKVQSVMCLSDATMKTGVWNPRIHMVEESHLLQVVLSLLHVLLSCAHVYIHVHTYPHPHIPHTPEMCSDAVLTIGLPCEKKVVISMVTLLSQHVHIH